MLVSDLHAVLRVKEREVFGVRVGVAEADVGDGRSRRSGQLLLPHRIEDLLEPGPPLSALRTAWADSSPTASSNDPWSRGRARSPLGAIPMPSDKVSVKNAEQFANKWPCRVQRRNLVCPLPPIDAPQLRCAVAMPSVSA